MENGSLLEKTKQLVKPQYNEIDNWTHGWPHITNVRDTSFQLAKRKGAKKDITGIIAYCHDLGRIIEEKEKLPDHATLSVEPTIRVLDQLTPALSQHDFGTIIGAIAVHSDFNYVGNKEYAKILRDADKVDSLGAWGILRSIKFTLKKDFVPQEEILKNQNNPKALEELAEKSIFILKKQPKSKEKYRLNLNKISEWIEKELFHLKSTYNLFSDKMEYILNVKKNFDF